MSYENIQTLAILPSPWGCYFQGAVFFSQVISFLILVEFLMFHLIYLATCQCTSQRIIGPKSGLCISSPQKGNHLQCFQTQNCYPCSCFLFLFSWKAPIQFHSRCSRLVSCYRIDSSEYISQIHVPTYLQDGIRVGNEEGGQRSGFSHHCPCPVVLGITILIQEVLHHDKELQTQSRAPDHCLPTV